MDGRDTNAARVTATARAGRGRWLGRRAGVVGVACVGGLLCVGLGVAVGRWTRTTQAPTVWQESEVRPAGDVQRAGTLTSFADIVAAARPGVVSVRARLVPASALFASEDGAAAVDDLDAAGGEPAGSGGAGPYVDEANGGDATNGSDAASEGARSVFEHEVGFRNGSGFLVNARGLVVTSRHVVLGARGIDVVVPGHGSFRADLVGEDEATDLAVLRLAEAPTDLPALPLGASEDLRAGDWIVALGNPYGFSQTVTAGVVSFVGRHLPHNDLRVTNDFVQISAPVNPGSSGGPVLDVSGRVVGVTTQAAADAEGISFAVPSRTLKWTLTEVERSKDGVVRRGYLGIEFATSRRLDEQGNPCGGARIVRVVPGAPAERAGLRRGDLVVAVDGAEVADAAALHKRIVEGRPGGELALDVLRDDKPCGPLRATLSEMGRARAGEFP